MAGNDMPETAATAPAALKLPRPPNQNKPYPARGGQREGLSYLAFIKNSSKAIMTITPPPQIHGGKARD